ncbi:hypothetical protein ACOCJ4_12010 [Knoellia sp. CPCC 206435]|uniref:hypothetical protein n=1 Tax=Knoellia terrae TaxID=3404797 RepID=UPI003B42D86E
MTVALTIERHGGWCAWRDLRAVHSRRAIERGLSDGSVIRVARNRYTLPTTVEATREAIRIGGTVSHLSAALLHGWPIKTVPDRTWVTVPRRRGALRIEVGPVHLHHGDLTSPERKRRVTTPLRTVLDCARRLPFDEALAVADSALRSGKVGRTELREAAQMTRGPGSIGVRRVAAHAHRGAANPLESVLRALTIEVGLVMTPQLQVAESGMYATVDLGDEKLRLIIEAEGYGTHGTRKGLRRDCRRHTEFAVFGWTSLRYAYEDAMFEQEWVRWTLTSWVDVRCGRPPGRPPRRSH